MAKYQRRELLRGEGPGHGLKTVELQNVISSHLGMPLPTLHSLAKCMNLLCNNINDPMYENIHVYIQCNQFIYI